MFADDTERDTAAEKLDFSHVLESNIKNEFNNMKEYLDYNRLSLNISIWKFILIDIHQTLVNMTIINVHINN